MSSLRAACVLPTPRCETTRSRCDSPTESGPVHRRSGCRRTRTIVARGRDEFDQDITLRLAGERVIELLAEAVNATAFELEQAYPDYPWYEPISMRNLLAHEYWRSDPDLVWTTLSVDIPEVADKVRALGNDPRDHS